MDQHARFSRLLSYERDVTQSVIHSLRSAKSHVEREGGAAMSPAFVRAVEIFAHVQAARRIWLSRIDAAATPPQEVFPAGWSLDRCAEEAAALDDEWSRLMAGLPHTGFDTNIEYTSTEGTRFTSTLADILTHVVNHGSYHRGQIARLIAECGAEPPVTDFIVWSRTAKE
jgi:uncharacterized damage-inducible protein DinB